MTAIEKCTCCGEYADTMECSCNRLWCGHCGQCGKHCYCLQPQLRERPAGMAPEVPEEPANGVPFGDPGHCRSPRCNAEIIWGEKNGKPHPWNLDGTSHFATCVDAKYFRRRGNR